jgi:hypothetical protein
VLGELTRPAEPPESGDLHLQGLAVAGRGQDLGHGRPQVVSVELDRRPPQGPAAQRAQQRDVAGEGVPSDKGPGDRAMTRGVGDERLHDRRLEYFRTASGAHGSVDAPQQFGVWMIAAQHRVSPS